MATRKKSRKPARKAAKKRAAPKPARKKIAAKKKPAARRTARAAGKPAPRRKPVRARSVVPPDARPRRGHHDMGGLPAGKVVPAEHDYAPWEKRVDAMMVLLSDRKRGLMNTDMLRRGIESLPADAYERMSYYERWIHSVATMMLERGIITREELDARIARLRAGS